MATDYLSSKSVNRSSMVGSSRSNSLRDLPYREAPAQWRHDSFSSRGNSQMLESQNWKTFSPNMTDSSRNVPSSAYRSVAGVASAGNYYQSSSAVVPYPAPSQSDQYKTYSGPVVFSAEPQSKKTVGNQTKRVTRHVKEVLSSNLEALVLKVTKPKYSAPREVYIEQIIHLLTGLGSPGADMRTCSDIVRKLWNKCQIQDWRVCCKALYVFERIFRDLSFDDAVAFKRTLSQRQTHLPIGGETFVNFATLGRFEDANPTSRPEGPQVSVFIRNLAGYLSSRINTFEKMQKLTGTMDSKPSRAVDEFGYTSEAGKRIVAQLPKDTIFETLFEMQELLDYMILRVRLEDENKNSWYSTVKGVLVNDVTVVALYPVASDVLDLFRSIHENLTSLLEDFFELDLEKAGKARDIYAVYILQVPRVQEYLEIAKEQFRTRGIPLSTDLKYHPLDLLDDMDEYISRKSGENTKSTVTVEKEKIEEEKQPKRTEEGPVSQQRNTVEPDLISGDDNSALIDIENSSNQGFGRSHDFFEDLSVPKTTTQTVLSTTNSTVSDAKNWLDLSPLPDKSRTVTSSGQRINILDGKNPQSVQSKNIIPKGNPQDSLSTANMNRGPSVASVLQGSLSKSNEIRSKDLPSGSSQAQSTNVSGQQNSHQEGKTSGAVVPYGMALFDRPLSELFDKRVIESKHIEVRVTDLAGELDNLKRENGELKQRLERAATEYEHKRQEIAQLRVQVVSSQKKLEEDLEKLKTGEQLKLDLEKMIKGNNHLASEINSIRYNIKVVAVKSPLDLSLIEKSLGDLTEEFYRLASLKRGESNDEVFDRKSVPLTWKIMDLQRISELIGLLDEIYRAVYYGLKFGSENANSNTFDFGAVQKVAFDIYETRKKLTTSFSALLSEVKSITAALNGRESSLHKIDREDSNSDSDFGDIVYNGPHYTNPFDEE
eukprot:jgi/Galph1/4238/GphlegSOOS_G2890.1